MRWQSPTSQQGRRARECGTLRLEWGAGIASVPVPEMFGLPPHEEEATLGKEMRLLVFGGRDYPYRGHVHHEILEMTDGVPFTRLTIIHGDANRKKQIGADYWAHEFCELWRDWGVKELPFPAKWEDFTHPDSLKRMRSDGTAYNVRAGFIRNQQMLDEGKPTHALGFPGGNGTADMRQRIERAIKDGTDITFRIIS